MHYGSLSTCFVGSIAMNAQYLRLFKDGNVVVHGLLGLTFKHQECRNLCYWVFHSNAPLTKVIATTVRYTDHFNMVCMRKTSRILLSFQIQQGDMDFSQ